jgi:hypothetical protein
MKKLYGIILCLLFVSNQSLAQQASEYFPVQSGFSWRYLLTPLDSANNGLTQLAFYRADSFANVANYKGKMANIVVTKKGSLTSLPSQSYDDSLFFHFDGPHAFEYSDISNEEALLQKLDSLEIDPNFSFVDFFASLENWYSVFRFEQISNNEYSVFMIDTTLNNGVITIPLRFEYLGTRHDDQVIETQIGPLNCKRFLIKKSVSMVIAPTIQIPIVVIEDSVWIAPEKWIVKVVTPSTFVDLSFFSSDPILVPGLITEVTDIIAGVEENVQLPAVIYLYQNYPNPFNPKTNIQFMTRELGFISLKVFDAIGNDVNTLVYKELPAGTHSAEFDATGLASGLYFCRLQVGDIVMTRKMILLR